jgi:hypothetical protein
MSGNQFSRIFAHLAQGRHIIPQQYRETVVAAREDSRE